MPARVRREGAFHQCGPNGPRMGVGMDIAPRGRSSGTCMIHRHMNCIQIQQNRVVTFQAAEHTGTVAAQEVLAPTEECIPILLMQGLMVLCFLSACLLWQSGYEFRGCSAATKLPW